MLYIPWIVILGDHNIKENFSNTWFFELFMVKSCLRRLCTHPLGDPPRGPNTLIG